MKLLQDVRIGVRLALGFASVLLLSCATIGQSFFEMSQLQGRFDDLAGMTMPAMNGVSELGTAARGMRGAQELLATRWSESERATQADAFKKHHARFVEQITLLRSLPRADAIEPQLAPVDGALKSYETSSAEIERLLASADDAERFQKVKKLLEGETLANFTTLSKAAADLTKVIRDDADARIVAASAGNQRSRTAMAVGGAIALALGSLLAWGLTTSVVRPMRSGMAALQRIAGGDLSGRIDSERRDEMGQLMAALAQMQDNLRTAVGDIRNSSDSVYSAASEIAQGNLSLSDRTERQAASLEETASSMETMSATVKESAGTVNRVEEISRSARQAAGRGQQVVGDVVKTMQEIQQSSDRIASIISVIDGIAFQTNILALNAAVEAARAGEQGRGFAVVAGEVRSLAQRSAGAAREIKQLITDSAEKVGSGSRHVADAGRVMQDIHQQVSSVNDLVGEIRRSAAQQHSGIEQVTQAVSLLDHSTQENAALVEEASASAESLKTQAQKLLESVAAFKTEADAGVLVPSSVKPAVHGHPAALGVGLVSA
ncbi:methyl-accepting chemotaxis protein [Rhizobacter sp. OV335]|uniref:methyl-accepting chemotaxis protein n=1 Tax=Rhizobacter sp. OV335 TaxID=1500264 RepID=UPI00091D0659|nr:methyl-accepting chemotaxis protein [Rhizobacter sp. OV335]SHL96854.1 methyl-accepting chemotaxis protein [Rhizobacter sp. OV335]